MIFSEQNENVSKAYAKAWSELKNPKHNTTVKVKLKNGGSYTFDYTDLGGIFEETKDPFKDNELSIMQSNFSDVIDGQLYVGVQTTFLHSSGEWMKSDVLRVKANPNIQDMGGQQTYLRRYQLSAMLGISTEKDDDANGASGNSYDMDKKPQKQPEPNLNEQLTDYFTKAVQEFNGDKDKLYETLGKTRDDMAKLYDSKNQKDKKAVIKKLEGIVVRNDNNKAG